MHILLVGLSHKSAPLEVRESVSFLSDQLPEALGALKKQIGESVILSTCNRTEIYSITENPSRTVEQIHRFVANFHQFPIDIVSPHLYDYRNANAVRHLFRVASGLDSMIVGESQVLGQVRDALSAASESQSVQVSTVGLFHAAVRVGRKVREETDIGRNPLSVSYAGVQLAKRKLGSLEGIRVLLVGAGETGQLVARALRTVGVGDLMIANRTLSRAEELAGYLGGRAIPFSEIGAALGDANIAIAATDSPDYVITRDMAASAFESRNGQPLFLFDLAVPRDVDPKVTDAGDVHLFNIDDLSSIAEENLEERKRAAVEAEAIVDSEVSRFMNWWDSLDVLPTIRALRQQAEDIRQRELARALEALDGLSAEQMQVIEALSRSLVNKLLHDPTKALKQGADKAQVLAARDLFRLWDDESGPT